MSIDFYELVLFVHISSAVIAWGATFTFPIFVRMARSRGVTDVAYFFATAGRIGQMVVLPASLLLLASGVTMVLDSESLTFGGDEMKWIDVSMTLLVVLILLGPLFFVRQEKKIQAAVDDPGGQDQLDGLLDRYLLVARINSLIVLFILFLMATKPF